MGEYRSKLNEIELGNENDGKENVNERKLPESPY